MYKKINDRSDLFLDRIPRWVTHNGFFLMLLLIGIVIFCASLLTIPKTARFRVIINNQQATAVVAFPVYRQMHNGQELTVHSPLQDEPLEGTVDLQRSWSEKNMVYIPISLKAPLQYKITVKDTLQGSGEMLLEKSTLLQKALSKH